VLAEDCFVEHGGEGLFLLVWVVAECEAHCVELLVAYLSGFEKGLYFLMGGGEISEDVALLIAGVPVIGLLLYC